MKKVSITILLVLPFILIYFISILGKVIQRYGHLAVEWIEVYMPVEVNRSIDEKDEFGVFTNKYKIGNEEIFKVDLDGVENATFKIDVVVGPNDASNKDYSIYNTDTSKSNIEIVDGSAYLTLYSRGISKYTISTQENPRIKTSFYVLVEYGDLKGMTFFDKDNPSVIYTDGVINIPVGRKKQLGVIYDPITTREEFKDLTWTFSKPLDFMAPISFDEGGKLIRATNPGKIVATATSKIPNKEGVYVSSSLTINVTASSEEKVYFNFFKGNGSALLLPGSTIDFKTEGGQQEPENSGRILFNDPSIGYDDLFLTVVSGVNYLDLSQIDNFIIKFTQPSKVATIKLNLRLENNQWVELDSITIMSNKVI